MKTKTGMAFFALLSVLSFHSFPSLSTELKPALLDFDNHLKEYFMAEFKIERVADDPQKLAPVLKEYGVRDLGHFQEIRESFYAYVNSAQAKTKYGSPEQIMQIKLDVTSNLLKQESAGRAAGEISPLLQPIEGISLEQWAKAQAQMAQGKALQMVLNEQGIDRAKWDRVSAQWNQRMSQDTTLTISQEYSKHFLGSGEGRFGEAGKNAAEAMNPDAAIQGKEPFSFEKWIEITQALSAGAEQGKNAADVLASYGMNAADWGTSSAWWAQKFNANAMQMHGEYMRLSEKYHAQFSTKKP